MSPRLAAGLGPAVGTEAQTRSLWLTLAMLQRSTTLAKTAVFAVNFEISGLYRPSKRRPKPPVASLRGRAVRPASFSMQRYITTALFFHARKQSTASLARARAALISDR